MMSEREYDVVLYGASGFVGRQTARYFAERVPAGQVRWALAGRNRDKLATVRAQLGDQAETIDILVADSGDPAAVDALVARTRVVLNTAGPFALYANHLVDACVRHRSHYVDITGETPWVKDLIGRYHAQAAHDGTRIVPFCGFDSVPSDLGTYLVVRRLQQQFGVPCEIVKAYFQVYGGFNGGTLASAFNLYASGRVAEARDPFLLNPPGEHSPAEIEYQRDPAEVYYDTDIGCWVGPFFMGPVNSRVVRRSSALFAQWGAPYGPDFGYQEYLKFSGSGAWLKAAGITAGLTLFDGAMRFGPVRRLLQAWLPQPGSGPSEQTMNRGWFCCELLGLTVDGRRLSGVIRDQGDPGNRATVKFLCESALSLVLDSDALPGGPPRGGVLTPATALGDVLAERLRRAGMVIQVG